MSKKVIQVEPYDMEYQILEKIKAAISSDVDFYNSGRTRKFIVIEVVNE